jgi:hypothetical protein
MEVIENVLPPLKVGDNLLVSIPSVDRGQGDSQPCNYHKKKDGKFRIGTKEGILSSWLERNSLAATKYCFLTTVDVQQN